ncbi:hypothetical protein [Streptomyces sp. NPDC053048]|uniref:hypothetical protein n=1 Tax=Streptomyces sp. NPDC053048 TaxID=3365694 RepID=UPI0037D540E7
MSNTITQGIATETPTPVAQLVTVEGSSYGPYRALNTTRVQDAYMRLPFSRSTAQQIVEDLTRDDCGLRAEWHGDELVFTWSSDYMGEAGTETVRPDDSGLYLVGGLWPWDFSAKPSLPTVDLTKQEREFFVVGTDGVDDYEIWHVVEAPADESDAQDLYDELHWDAYDAFGSVTPIFAVSHAHAAGIARHECHL